MRLTRQARQTPALEKLGRLFWALSGHRVLLPFSHVTTTGRTGPVFAVFSRLDAFLAGGAAAWPVDKCSSPTGIAIPPTSAFEHIGLGHENISLFQVGILGLLAWTGVAFASGLSGTYVAESATSAFLVQIVETGNGQLTGRYEQFVLNPDGKTEDMSAQLTGAVNGQTVVVTIKPSGIFGGEIAASGAIRGDKLFLSAGAGKGNLNVSLHKSDESEFRAQVAALTAHGGQITGDNARRQFAQKKDEEVNRILGQTRAIEQKIEAFEQAANNRIPKFDETERRYRSYTSRMQTGLDRERGMVGGWQAKTARGQMSVAISQVAVEAGVYHTNIQVAAGQVNYAINAIQGEIADAEKDCNGADLQVALAIPSLKSDAATTKAECDGFLGMLPDFRAASTGQAEAFNRLEAVWKQEKTKQDQLYQEATNAAYQ